MSKPRLVELLERELRPYVGSRAEFIAKKITPGVADEFVSMIAEAIDKVTDKHQRERH